MMTSRYEIEVTFVLGGLDAERSTTEVIGELMSSSNIRPKWWHLYLTFPLLITLFLLDSRLRLSQRGHIAVQIGILLVVYGLVHLWLKANAVALSQMDRNQYRGTIRVIQVPVSLLSEAEAEKHPLFQMSHFEIKGVLSDTFEMDYVDAESFPIDEISQEEVKKE